MHARLADPDSAARWLQAQGARALHTDSRAVGAGDAFLAWPGRASDGRRHVRAALAAGAAACLVEADGLEACGLDGDARIAAYAGLKAGAGAVADVYYGAPSAQLAVIASTGTNGKTSTTWWCAQALALAGRRCGLVGTLGIGEPPLGERPARLEASGLTTPDAVRLQAALAAMRDGGYAACALEASSIGLVEQRLAGTRIRVALFTNLTQDHLDYHGSMTAYWEAKRALFDTPGLQAAVVNVDDPHGAALAETLRERPLALWTCSTQAGGARLWAGAIGYRDGGLAFRLHEDGASEPVATALIGDYNVDNLLAVVGALRALGVPLAEAARLLAQLTPVPGRMQRLGGAPGQPLAVVDYAHTPDALEKTLAALRPLAAARGGRLLALFGCGGNRDATKRPLMGAAAERLADALVLTSDNPRDEAPAHILAQIAAGLQHPQAARVVEDRGAAIAATLAAADACDVLLIAGKGHEDHQEVVGLKRPFSDVDAARRALAARPQP